ncbi:hypothetical protein [Pararobbsia alpina]|uniref:hypothetical protein n=1 Tax=Pararobbsia alpina TaxID=621374 RepID=UPI0015834C67|nr:hypothetical protein [Pararobbsia alpina]
MKPSYGSFRDRQAHFQSVLDNELAKSPVGQEANHSINTIALPQCFNVNSWSAFRTLELSADA